MTLIRAKAPPNPLRGWQVDPAHIRMVGRDLARPECILAERDGSLWTADARGGLMMRGGREAIGRQPLRHRIGFEEGAIDFVRGGGEHPVQTDGTGHCSLLNG